LNNSGGYKDERQSAKLCFVCGEKYESDVLVKNVSQNENEKLHLCWKCEETSL
jgi:transposase